MVDNETIILPFDIWDALTYIGLPKSEMSCLMLIIKKTVGWDKKRDEIAISQFIKATRLPKSSIFRALNSLKKKRIIFSLKNETRINITYGFNSRIQDWKSVSKMRLDIKNETDHQSTNENNKKNKIKLVLKKPRDGVSKMRLHSNTSITSSNKDTGVSLLSTPIGAQKRMSDSLRNNKTDLIPKKKSLTLTKKNKRIFDYYYQEYYKKQPSLNTQAAKKAKHCLNKLARGILFNRDTSLKKYHNRKFSEKEIRFAIDRHITKAVDDSYKPANKGFMFVYLADFFYNKFSRIKSLFLDSLENEPVPVVPVLVDRNPELSKALFDVYNEEARNGLSMTPFDKLTHKDKNCFTAGAFKLNKFLKMNDNRIIKPMLNTHQKKAMLLWKTIMMCANNDLKKVHAFWFKADFVFERLPNYMTDRGFLTSNAKRSAFVV